MNSPDDLAASAEDEALRWLVDFEDLSAIEQARFHVWLDQRPENRMAFEKVERDWRRLDAVRQLASGTADAEVVEKWLRRRRLRRRLLPLAAAAGVAAVAVVAMLLPHRDYDARFRTAIGQHEEVRLPDDSVMTLNTNSEATVHYDAGQRRVWLLRGEAHFVIAPAAERPFSVVAGAGIVRAVGTAFNVYLKGEVVEVTVTQGIVDVLPNAFTATDGEADANGKVEMKSRPTPTGDRVRVAALDVERVTKGQKVEYREMIEAVSSVDPEKVARKLAWQTGMLDFQGDTLADVINEASRYTKTRIEISDPEI
ncbi:MAG TPA: FecR domain-containing protein, partial [Woeseiaceae bacterium]|nr:FecR domain-containing protein [Woeseiaceae bacterium]